MDVSCSAVSPGDKRAAVEVIVLRDMMHGQGWSASDVNAGTLRIKERDLRLCDHRCVSEGREADVLTKVASATERVSWMQGARWVSIRSSTRMCERLEQPMPTKTRPRLIFLEAR